MRASDPSHLVRQQITTASERNRIVFQGGDPSFVAAAQPLFRSQGWVVLPAQALDYEIPPAADGPLLAIVTDICADGIPDPEIVRDLRRRHATSHIVVFTAYSCVELALTSIRAGANDYVAKPLTPCELLLRIQGCSKQVSRTVLPTLARVEWEYMHRALAQNDGNISRTARQLGVQRSTLQRKLRKYPPPR